MSRKSRFQI